MKPIHVYPSQERPGMLCFDANRDSPRLAVVPERIRKAFQTPKPDERTVLLENEEIVRLTRTPFTPETQQRLRALYDRS